MKKIIIFLLLIVGIGSKASATSVNPDSLNLILRSIVEPHYTTLGDTAIQPLRLLGERGMTDPYKEQNNSGIANKAEADLKAAAMALVAAIPATIAADFKVYDYTAYSLIGRMENPEFWNEWAFGAMDSIIRTQYNVQHYLLIAKEIDPSNGKVKFRVKLSLPTVVSTGNRPSGDRSVVGDWDKIHSGYIKYFEKRISASLQKNYLSKNSLLDVNKSEIPPINELATDLKKISENEWYRAGIYYNPSGYPVTIPSSIGIVWTNDIVRGIIPNGVVWEWKNGLDKDGNFVGYQAHIKNGKFLGYQFYKEEKGNKIFSDKIEDYWSDYPLSSSLPMEVKKSSYDLNCNLKEIRTNYNLNITITKNNYYSEEYELVTVLKKGEKGYIDDIDTDLTKDQISGCIEVKKLTIRGEQILKAIIRNVKHGFIINDKTGEPLNLIIDYLNKSVPIKELCTIIESIEQSNMALLTTENFGEVFFL